MSQSTPSSAPWVTHPWVAASQGTIRFGLFGGPWADWPRLRDFVQLAEALGFDAYWMPDHPLQFPDCWTQLAALAVTTKTIRLGSLVSCIYYRSPALLARLAADVDRLSMGRVVLGLGMGDNAEEFAHLGIPMPPVRERQHALEDSVQIVAGLWGETPYTYQGQHFQVREAQVRPGPVQQPRVPLLIAGGGEQVTLRQVAQYADVANFGAHARVGSAFTLADVRRKVAALRQHCERLGRPDDSVLRSGWTGPVVCGETASVVQTKLERIPPAFRAFWAASIAAGTPQELIAHYQTLVEAGLQYFTAVTWWPGWDDVDTVRLLAEQVIPALVPAETIR